MFISDPANFKKKIENAGFCFVVFQHFNIELQKRREGNRLNAWIDCFISVFNDFRLKNILKIIDELDVIIKRIAPDLILLDSYWIQKAVLYGKYSIRTVSFETMVLGHYASNVPPYNSAFVPKDSLFSIIYVDVLWLFHECYTRYRILKACVLYFNNDNYSIYKKLSLKYGVELEKWRDIKRMNSSKLVPKGTLELVIPPLCFDFPRPEKANAIYIGPLVDMSRDRLSLDGRYVNVIIDIKSLKQKNKDILFIYVSLGTMSAANLKRERKFINMLLEFCKFNKKYQIVFSVGNNYDIQNFPALPDNLHVFKSVPQLDILRYCDLMITHGGMNTLTECILNEVPIIVYPLAGNWDQNGNAARVAYHGIGIKDSFRKISARNLEKNINRISEKYDYYKRNIMEMNARLDMEGVAQRAVKIVESFIN